MQGTWQAVGKWLAFWSLSGELWPCSDILASLVVYTLQRSGSPCRVLSVHVEKTLDGEAGYQVFSSPLSFLGSFASVNPQGP